MMGQRRPTGCWGACRKITQTAGQAYSADSHVVGQLRALAGTPELADADYGLITAGGWGKMLLDSLHCTGTKSWCLAWQYGHCRATFTSTAHYYA